MASTNTVAERPVRCTCTHLHSAHSTKGCEHCKCKAYRPDSTPKVLREVGVSSGEWHMRSNRQLEVQLMSRECDKTRVYDLLLLRSTPSHRKGSRHELETEEGTRRNIGRMAVVDGGGGVFRPLQNSDILNVLNATEYDPLRRMTENWLKRILRELEEERKIRRGGRPVKGQRTIHVYTRPSLRPEPKKLGHSHTPNFSVNQTNDNDLRVELRNRVNAFASTTVKALYRFADKFATDESIAPRLQEVTHHWAEEELKQICSQLEERMLAALIFEPEPVPAEAVTVEPDVPLNALRPLFPGEAVSNETLNNLHHHLSEQYADVYTPYLFIGAVKERLQAGPIRFGLLLRWEPGFWVDDLFLLLRRDLAARKEQEEGQQRYQQRLRDEFNAEYRRRLQDPATRSDTLELLTDTARQCGLPVVELYPELADLISLEEVTQ